MNNTTLALASISTSKAMLRLLLSYVYLHFLFGMHNVRGLQVASSTKNALPRAWWHKQVAEVVRTTTSFSMWHKSRRGGRHGLFTHPPFAGTSAIF